MIATIPLEEAKAHLDELIDGLAPGEVVLIVRGQQPIARLVAEPRSQLPRPEPGLGKGGILYMAPDFDETPDEFRDIVE